MIVIGIIIIVLLVLILLGIGVIIYTNIDSISNLEESKTLLKDIKTEIKKFGYDVKKLKSYRIGGKEK
jgi:septation ring formation regulator EzrA